jgi:hypothetical protein
VLQQVGAEPGEPSDQVELAQAGTVSRVDPGRRGGEAAACDRGDRAAQLLGGGGVSMVAGGVDGERDRGGAEPQPAPRGGADLLPHGPGQPCVGEVRPGLGGVQDSHPRGALGQ